MTYPEALKVNIKTGLMTYEQAYFWLYCHTALSLDDVRKALK
jgi:hypothetical protein